MIEAHDLTKSFGTTLAVDGITLSLGLGATGFLGPNGAGKSTTMRLLVGYFAPNSGSVRICGHDVNAERRAAQACIGYLPEAVGGFPGLTVREFLTYCGETRGLWGAGLRHAMARIVEDVDLGDAFNKQLSQLSKGWRQRAWFAQTLLSDPPVLILDEPTDGLDPNQKDYMRALVRRLAPSKTILLSTHILEEVEEVCDRAVIIAQGRIVADDTPENLADAKGRLAETFRRTTQTSAAGLSSQKEAVP